MALLYMSYQNIGTRVEMDTFNWAHRHHVGGGHVCIHKRVVLKGFVVIQLVLFVVKTALNHSSCVSNLMTFWHSENTWKQYIAFKNTSWTYKFSFNMVMKRSDTHIRLRTYLEHGTGSLGFPHRSPRNISFFKTRPACYKKKEVIISTCL